MRAAGLLLLIALSILPLAAGAQDSTTWPHTVAGPNGATAVVYQPQAVSWPDQKTLTTRLALAITPAGAKAPTLGTVELSFATTIDNAAHLVTLSDPKLITSHSPRWIRKKPVIFVSTKPAEIIVTDGPVQFTSIPGTGLQYVKNTASDLFFDPAQSKFYDLISGRWFAASGLDGPSTFASDNLPADFCADPPGSARCNTLASVPGTLEAQLAVIHAQIPQQAKLKRSEAKLTVTYAGQPRFKPIPGTELTYAVNTSFQVIGVGGKYYQH